MVGDRRRACRRGFAAGLLLALRFCPANAGLSAAEDELRDHAHLSIVVLPFANLSSDPSQDSSQMASPIDFRISRIRNSFVIARDTAFTFKGKNVDAKAIGKDLSRYILRAPVQRDGTECGEHPDSSTPGRGHVCGIGSKRTSATCSSCR